MMKAFTWIIVSRDGTARESSCTAGPQHALSFTVFFVWPPGEQVARLAVSSARFTCSVRRFIYRTDGRICYCCSARHPHLCGTLEISTRSTPSRAVSRAFRASAACIRTDKWSKRMPDDQHQLSIKLLFVNVWAQHLNLMMSHSFNHCEFYWLSTRDWKVIYFDKNEKQRVISGRCPNHARLFNVPDSGKVVRVAPLWRSGSNQGLRGPIDQRVLANVSSNLSTPPLSAVTSGRDAGCVPRPTWSVDRWIRVSWYSSDCSLMNANDHSNDRAPASLGLNLFPTLISSELSS